MKVFVTGASGWIGFATVKALLASGHQVRGLVRSDEGAAKVEAAGATAVRGDLDDLELLRREASAADGVIHLGNKHDWANQAATNTTEHHAVKTLCDALAGTGKPFALASGAGAIVDGHIHNEDDPSPWHGIESPRGGSENLAVEYVAKGVRVSALRYPPTVHGTIDDNGVTRAWGGFIPLVIQAARTTGVSGYPGDGTTHWSACHVDDAARANVLALEKARAGFRAHIVADEAITTRAIAEAVGASLKLPVKSIPADEVDKHFGFIGFFFAMDRSASSAKTRQVLGWAPTHPSLLEDIAAGS
jgi:nucleoside-diphosphate-sugar epimerase